MPNVYNFSNLFQLSLNKFHDIRDLETLIQRLSKTNPVFKDFFKTFNLDKKIPGLSKVCGNPICMCINVSFVIIKKVSFFLILHFTQKHTSTSSEFYTVCTQYTQIKKLAVKFQFVFAHNLL